MSDLPEEVAMPQLKDRSRKVLEKLREAGVEAGQLVTDASIAGAEGLKAGAGRAKRVTDDALKAGAERAKHLTDDALKTGAERAKRLTDDALKKGRTFYSSFKKEDEELALLESQQKTLADLSPELQDQYLDALLALLVPFDASHTEQLSRVYQILAVMNLPSPRRRNFLDRLFSTQERPEAAELSQDDEVFRFSLAKDLLSLGGTATSDTEGRIQGLLARLNLSTEQVDALNNFTNWENRMMRKIGREDLTVGSEDLPAEAMKKAGAVGIPLTALYFSGSVVGFSAAGLTSGLATLGGAAGLTALGLNPMTAGIAVLVLGGVAVKKVLDATLPTTDAERKSRLQAGVRLMENRRNRYLAILGQDLAESLRVLEGEIEGEERQAAERSTHALRELLDLEARATLGLKTS